MNEWGAGTVPLISLYLLSFSFAFIAGACVQSEFLPLPPTPTPAASTVEAPDLSELTDQLAAEYGLAQDIAGSVVAKRIEAAGDKPLYVAFTVAYPPDD